MCLAGSTRWNRKINATGIASEGPGKAREIIGIANLHQMKFCQLKIHQIKLRQKVAPRKKKFGQKKQFGRFLSASTYNS